MKILLSIFFLLFTLTQCTIFAGEEEQTNCWNGLVFYAENNALFAADCKTGKPAWSETGEFYRETFDFNDSEELRGKSPTSRNGHFPHVIRHNRLYVILPKSAQYDKFGTVLLAFSLKQEGKVIWRIDQPVVGIESLVGDNLTVRLKNAKLLHIDVATGEPFDEAEDKGKRRKIDNTTKKESNI